MRGAPETPIAGASIDSRSVGSGELFVAIVGPNNDAHRFLPGAVERGAAALLVERIDADTPTGAAVIEVDDTTRALGDLAAGHRGRFDGPVVAITGSNGKTTTKEMCADILSMAAPCRRTPGNLNNRYGLPLTLLGRAQEDRSLVVELGMNHRGEIAQLAALARPTVGVLTNVGSAHIEHLGSREEIALEKGDLVAGLAEDATAVLNTDDPFVAAQAQRTAARVVTFGTGSDADVRAREVAEREDGYAFVLQTPEGEVAVWVPGLGPTTVINALAASAAAQAAGASLTQVASGLAAYRPVAGRLDRRELSGSIVLVDDTYNANPQSTEAALQLLAGMKEGRALFVFGDMGELGTASDAAHHEVGRLAASLGIDFLIALGEQAGRVVDGALEAGMAADRAQTAKDHKDAGARANALLRDGDSVLVKGSRAMQMERVVEAIAACKGS